MNIPQYDKFQYGTTSQDKTSIRIENYSREAVYITLNTSDKEIAAGRSYTHTFTTKSNAKEIRVRVGISDLKTYSRVSYINFVYGHTYLLRVLSDVEQQWVTKK